MEELFTGIAISFVLIAVALVITLSTGYVLSSLEAILLGIACGFIGRVIAGLVSG